MILRPMKMSDAEPLMLLARDPEVFALTTPPPAETLEEWRAMLAAIADMPWTFTAEHGGEIVGAFSMLRQAGQYSHRTELGGWLGRHSWGKGLAPQAFRFLIVFAERNGLLRVEARAAEDNPNSARAVEKAGMRLESVAQNAIVRGEHTIDELLYVWVKGVDECPG